MTHMGPDRRANERDPNSKERHGAPMSIVITGNRFPIGALLSFIVAGITAAVLAVIWLLNIQGISNDALITAKANQVIISQNTKTVNNTVIVLESLVGQVALIQKRQDENIKYDADAHAEIRMNKFRHDKIDGNNK